MKELVLETRALAAAYGSRDVFQDITLQLPRGQALGVIGASGAGKTTLLRMLVGLLQPRAGDLRIIGRPPRDALRGAVVGYFAGEATLPGSARAAAWGRLGASDLHLPERRRIRTLSRGTRQMLGLRTVLSRHPLDLVVLDEPWESLDEDDGRWLSATLEKKRDRGAALVLSSHRLHDLAGVCDAYLCLVPPRAALLPAHEIAPGGVVTGERLAEALEQLRSDKSRSLTLAGTA